MRGSFKLPKDLSVCVLVKDDDHPRRGVYVHQGLHASLSQQLLNRVAHCFMFRLPAGLQGFSDTIIF